MPKKTTDITLNAYTGNPGKLEEIKRLLPGVIVNSLPLDIQEIQSLDPREVALAKAKAAYEVSGKEPGVIEDVSVIIPALKGLPGPYIDAFMKTLGNEGIVKLLEDSGDRSASALINVVYTDNKGESHIFEGEVRGSIAEKPRGEGFGWDPIFIPKGETRTFGEMTPEEKDKYSMRAIAFAKLLEYLKNN